jgi:GDP-4-dehydro-6-deoxy-D-mannose reductase
MTPRRILVTGASGFVGGHLLPALRHAFPEAELVASSFDITDRAAVAATVRATAPDACIHLAAIASVPAAREDPERAWQVNLHGTLNLAQAMRANAPACLILFASSADAYGASFRSGNALDESAPLAPLNLYGATKAAADLALGALATEGLRVVRLRFFNQTGPGQSPAFAIPAFANQLARIAAGRQESVLHVGALDPHRDFLDVRDACAVYVRCLLHADALMPGTIFNIASGTPRRIGDVLDELIGLAGVTVRVEVEQLRLRPTDIPTATGDAGYAHRLLGWSPQIPWGQTLRDVLDDWDARVMAEADRGSPADLSNSCRI